ncbi:hypothetical protein BGZ80_011017, partial [Entomortierella chlamydospora]
VQGSHDAALVLGFYEVHPYMALEELDVHETEDVGSDEASYVQAKGKNVQESCDRMVDISLDKDIRGSGGDGSWKSTETLYHANVLYVWDVK